MNRTINEKKSMTSIIISMFMIVTFHTISAAFNDNFLISIISYGFMMISVGVFGYSFYSLGWEYKRIQIDDVKEVEDE